MTITFTESNQQDVWENRYQNRKTAWDRGQSSPALGHWLPSMCPPPARILVPACGCGHEVVTLCEQGYAVTAIDFAQSAIETLNTKLHQKELRADVIQADLLTWESTQAFDIIYEQTALCALEPALWHNYADRLYRWLTAEGLLLGLFMQTDREGGPPWHCAIESLKEVFPATRWHWPPQQDQRVMHPSGFNELALVLKRRNSAR
ncbi:MAG: methyltransferase domain-containing protein [Arenicellales bacterium]|nr:methyltransferase domain-containing protein [Arenicellales bacterium]